MELKDYSAKESLINGAPLMIRAIRQSDKELLRDGFKQLSPNSIHLRFLAAKTKLTHQELVYLTELDFHNHVGLVAGLNQEGRMRYVGVGRYVRIHGENQCKRAEIALTVMDAYQGFGVGTALLRHLIKIAQDQKIDRFVAEVQAENTTMFELLEETGLPLQKSIKRGTALIAIDLQPNG